MRALESIPERDRLLLLGAPGSGKSKALVDIALELPHITVYAFDAQDSIAPLLRAAGGIPDNFKLFRSEGEPVEAWDDFQSTCKQLRREAKPGDFICFDIAQDWWQLVQDAYVEQTYGVTTAELKQFKMEQESDKAKKGKKALGFGGLSTDDWQIIKGKYYITIPQTLGTRTLANVIVTANEKTPANYMKDGELVFLEANLPGPYRKNLVKPAGESSLTSQVDVVLWLKQPREGKWTCTVLGKNRFKVGFKDEEITDSTMWSIYCGAQDRDPSRSPGEGDVDS